MNRFLVWGGLMLTLLLALACSSGGEGIKVTNNITENVVGGADDDAADDANVFAFKSTVDSEYVGDTVFLRENGNVTADDLSATVVADGDDGAVTFEDVPELTVGGYYVVVVEDGDDVQMSYISAAETQAADETLKARSALSGGADLVVNVYTTAFVKTAQESGKDPVSFLAEVTNASSFKDLTLDANGDPESFGPKDTAVEVTVDGETIASTKFLFDALVSTYQEVITLRQSLATLEAALESVSDQLDNVLAGAANDVDILDTFAADATLTAAVPNVATQSATNLAVTTEVVADINTTALKILGRATNVDTPNFSVASTAPSVETFAVSGVDAFFTDTDYVGAIGSADWTADWTKAGTGSTSSTLNLEGIAITDLAIEANWTVESTDAGGGTISVHSASANIKRIQGVFNNDVSLDSDYEYILSGVVYIGDGTNAATITIEAGTTIRGLDEGSSKGVLVIRQNAKIMAEGTADEPIVFTSAKLAGAYSQDWGGLIICGKATTNLASNSGDPEGLSAGSAPYGGSDDTDSSGTLKYVRVEYGGWQIDSETELNGIGFYAVGSGTTVEYVQVHRNSDDGIEFFGGTVNAKYLLVTGCEDDSIDWTEGYRGNIQWAIVQQYPGFGDRGIEADNRGSDNSATPRSSPTLSNVTLIGSEDGDTGMVLRAGTGIAFYNGIVMNWPDAGVDVDNKDNTPNSGLTIRSTLFANSANYEDDSDGSDLELIRGGLNVLRDVDVSADNDAVTVETSSVLSNPFDIDAPAFGLSDAAPNVTPIDVNAVDSFFTTETFVGAVGSIDWASTWTKKGTGPTSSTYDLDGIALTSLATDSDWTVESADAGGQGTVSVHNSSANIKRLQGTFHSDIALDSDYEYVLSGVVYIGDGTNSSNITIEAGTTIRGLDEGSSKGVLVIKQNAQIFAEGTAAAPIVFTSAKLAGAYSQDWGGLIICGKATTNLDSNSGDPEGITAGSAPYGGDDDDDNSGVLKYVRVEYGGWQIDSETELNGVAFYAVGSGTTVEYLQVHRNSDDGVEFFGGTVDVKYLVVTGCEDDSIDWTEGYRGRIQYAVVQQYPGFGDRGIEADNRGSNNSATPKSSPTLSNITLIGGEDGDTGLVLRAGTGVSFYNSVVLRWSDAGLDVDNRSTTPNSGLTIQGVLFANDANFEDDSDGSDESLVDNGVNVLTTPEVENTTGEANSLVILKNVSEDSPNFQLADAAPSMTLTDVEAVSSFFTNETYVGAMGDTNWTTGWTKSGTGPTSSTLDLDGIAITDLAIEANWTVVSTDVGGQGTVSVHSASDNIRRIQGVFHDDLSLDSDYEYILSGVVYIGDGTNSSNITIEAGTTIRGLDEGSSKGVLVIRQNAQIFAEGTSGAPIVFTSAKLAGAYSQDWGGLIICGKARTNLDSNSGDPEGLTAGSAPYGGTNDLDNSGVLKYVRVEYGGWQIDSETELNGIAFYAVGSGTTVEYVQVHRNSDDGIEFFGGTVDAKYLLVTGCEDDSIDWTEGYTGRIQYAIVHQYAGFGDRGIEADNRGSDNSATPKSSPTLSNVTLIGSADGDTGLVLRAGTGIAFYNSIVMNWSDAGLDVDNKDNTPNSGLTIASTLFSNTANFENDSDGSDEGLISGNNNTLEGLSSNEFADVAQLGDGANESGVSVLVNASDIDSPDFTLASDAPEMTLKDVNGTVSDFFNSDSFVGAVGGTDWTSGWTKAGTGSTSSELDLDGIAVTDLATEANWTVETTDAGGQGTIAVSTLSANIKRIEGVFHSDISLDSDYEYILSGVVYIGDGTNSSNITIEAGTTIRGLDEGSAKGVLVIRQNAQIFAEGTASAPIVFTSAKLAGAYSQDWGGLIICGKATTNLQSGSGDPEGLIASSASYGGIDDTDNSGVLKYVRVEYGGWQIDSETELNGVGFYAVGSGTTVEYLQVHRNSDDGVEFFGGAVDVKYLLVTGCEDDSIDWTEGYTGRIQYAIVQQYPGFGDRGIEADNSGSDNAATPKSHPILSNVTLIGGEDGDTGMVLRAGTEIEVYNSIVLNWADAGVDVDNKDNTPNSGLTIESTLFANNANFENDSDGSDEGLISGNNNSFQ